MKKSESDDENNTLTRKSWLYYYPWYPLILLVRYLIIVKSLFYTIWQWNSYVRAVKTRRLSGIVVAYVKCIP